MNVNVATARALEMENSQLHEASTMTVCKPGKPIKKAKWVRREDLSKLDAAYFPLYYDEEWVMLVPFAHMLTIGSTGSGKSEDIYKNVPLIFSKYPDDKKPNLLVMDYKGDIYPSHERELREKGYEIKIIDMCRPYRSAPYNFLLPLYDCYQEKLKIDADLVKNRIGLTYRGKKYKTVDMARDAAYEQSQKLRSYIEMFVRQIAFIMIPDNIETRDPIWQNGARTMCEAIIWKMLKDSEDPKNGMTRECFTVSNICRIAFTTDCDCDYIVDWLTEYEQHLVVKSAITSNYRISAKVTRDGYISTLNTCLGKYANNFVGTMTATEGSVDVREIAKSEKPYAIFIVPNNREGTSDNICMLFINDLINSLIDVAEESPSKSLPRDFVILADEFANMPKMPEIKRRITTLRSYRVWISMAIQSISQLVEVYGEETTKTIKCNCDYTLMLGCNDLETKKWFSEIMGKTIGTKTSMSVSNDRDVSESKTTEDVLNVRISDIDSLVLGEILISSSKIGKCKTYMKPRFMQADYTGYEDVSVPPLRRFDSDAYAYDIREVVRRHEDNTAGSARRKFNFDFDV